ncbi:jg8421 [Pararge aegeria aegeria]|uniref:Jg8421 protein n=1 Tax=Pararge aegeria aegeria TaxID=348720 RepID=A0A8S4SG44_9NEOP|nr:jg8421 [Pararge aegeria aegeria]
MTTSSRSEEALENLQKNPYYEKYAERIATLQKTSPEEFLRKVEEQQKNKNIESKKKFASVDTRQFSSVLNPKGELKNDVTAEEKKLSDIFKVDLVKDKDATEVQIIWEEYHKNKEVLSATIPKDVYSQIQQNMKQYPTFLFPLPRSEGYEYIMCQSYGHAVHFTPLLAYQVHHENAPECLTMVHYTELSDKGIVLMRGDYDKAASPLTTRQFSSVLNPKGELKNDVTAEEKKLSDIFKVDLVKDKDATEVQIIWEEYHKNKEVLSATIPKDVYSQIQQNMKQYPTFLFPLPRSEGYEYIMCQSYGHAVHFTPLLAYQVHHENAPECLTMVHYTELSDKGIVLMRGDYDKNVLTGKEAQCLANQFQMYYNGKDENKYKLLQSFTKTPDSFKHVDLITELENIQLI